MPIKDETGAWYAPGTRKGNVGWAWRGKRADGVWTELVTHEVDHGKAKARIREALDEFDRRRPPAAGAWVDLDTAARHYKATLRSSDEKDRVDRVVRYLGAATPVAAVNQSHVSTAAAAFRAERGAARGRQTYPPPSAPTVNREITTPLRAILRFAAAQQWRPLIELRAVKPLEGERPSPPRSVARDADVDRLLAAVGEAIEACRPTPTGRSKGADQRRLALRALHALILAVHERGYRISEWLRWDWETIDLGRGQASILLSKPDRWVTFDLSTELVAALAALDARPAGKVFPWHGRSAVYAAVDAVAPEDIHWRPHDSRRAVVTAVIRATGDPVAAQRYVGHANIKTTLRYNVPEPIGPQVRSGGKLVGKR
ncbi:tyrosine-type recombinase/integrase [Reyranella sp.]|uniref:tyrosine-type recombinase/integrase n=1 Tax=Reyranella sp. TaxID=1929291 RepID=UPI003D103A67